MEIQELTEISEKIYRNLQALVPKDIKTIEDILAMESIEYGKIRTFSIEDSQAVILLTLKQNCLILIKYLLENEIEMPNKLIDMGISMLNIRDKMLAQPSTDLHAQMEKERIIENILNLIVDILFISKYSNQELLDFLKNKRVPDSVSVNLAICFDSELELESFELSVLNKKLIGPVLLSLIKSYKNVLRKSARQKILSEIKPYIFGKDKEIVYEIFYLINQEKHKDLLSKVKPENTDTYFGFICSMIVDKESAEMAYLRLEPYFDELEGALKTLLNLSKTERRSIQPKDEKTIFYLLECINKLIKYKSINFYKFISRFQDILKTKVCREIKGLIYEILCKYINDRDVYIDKIVECRDEIEKEIKSKNFFLLPRLIRFLNFHKKREMREIELLKIGVTVGSPYVLSADRRDGFMPREDPPSDLVDYRNLGFRSEDPNTIIECLDAFIQPETIKMNSAHIRNALIKDPRVVEKLIQFQIEHKVAIDDVSIINVILCYPSQQFFDFFRLVKGFSFYLNGDFLERLSDNLQDGIKWIKEKYNRELGVFILRNSGYFNDIIKKNPEIQNDIILIYEHIFDENLGEVEFKIFSDSENEEEYVFLLFDDQEFLVEELFRIFSKQLIFTKFYKPDEPLKGHLLKQYNSEFFEVYVKAKAVCGLDIENDVAFLKKNIIMTEDLLGYLKVSGLLSYDSSVLSQSILLNFGIKDSAYVLKNFETANDLERFVLFFSISDVSMELDVLLKTHVMKNLKNPNKIYLRMCVLQLFKCKDLDKTIKMLEKSFDDRELLFKLSIHNIINGGKYFSKSLIETCDDILKYKAIFLLYYLNIWEREYLLEIINKADPEVSEEMKYLFDDIKNQ